MPSGQSAGNTTDNRRLNIWYVLLIFILGAFVARLFYLQIVKHDHYRQAALSGQLKEYEIPADRGQIQAYENGNLVPLVLNQKLYTLFADPAFVKDTSAGSAKLAVITKGSAQDYAKAMKTPNTRYVVLAKRLSEAQNKAITNLRLAGVGTQGQNYRIYPQGSLAAQLLGFVNDEGQGKYGIEQYLEKTLSGTPGELKAITDAAGVPLAASRDNVQINPKNGSDTVLTIDVSMQKQLENILATGLRRASSNSGCALIIDPNNGAVKAMANWPAYDPAKFYKVSDAKLFNNDCVSSPLEVGSAMKSLTASAALDLGVIKQNTSYYDPSHWKLDGHEVTNIEEDGGAGTHNIADILNLSINTGATWMLMRMGGETGVVNRQARERWHDYMTNHFQLGKPTGIEQGYEAAGYIPDPNNGYGLQLAYANTAFGQAMTATMLQMAAALSSVVNGGTYYQPRLVDSLISSAGGDEVMKAKIAKSHVVSPAVGKSIRSLLDYAVRQHYLNGFNYLNFPSTYEVGGKTGTAQIANPSGGYYANRYNGTYIGFVGGAKPQYVIAVRVNEPHISGYAGSGAAQPIFSDLAHMLINNFNVTPKN